MSEPARPVWHPVPWLAAALGLVLAAGGLPLLRLAIAAAGDLGALGAELGSPRALTLLAHTALLAALVAVLAGAAGTLLGVLVAKTDLPLRGPLAALLTFPLFLPPYVVALGWFSVLGWGGLLPAVAGPAAAGTGSRFLFGLGGAALVLTTAYTPIALHLARLALRAVDPAGEEAARLAAGWPRVIRRIDLPLIAPAVALAMLLTFVLVAGEMGVPAYLRYPVFASEVFAQFAAFLNVRAAVAFSVPLAALVLAGVAAERWWLRARVRGLTRARAVNHLVAPLGRWRAAAGAAAWAYATATVLLPVAGLARRAGGAASYAAALRGAGASIGQSVWLAAAGATLALPLGVLLAYVVERAGRQRHDALDSLLLLLFAAPGTVLGVGLILVWNRPGFTWLYGSTAIILVGYVGHVTPLAARAAGIGLQALPPGVEEAARLARVGFPRALRAAVLPLVRPALAGAWFLAFVFCLRDLDLAVTVYPPGAEPLPVRVYTLMANSPEPVAAALALLMVGLTAALVAAAWGGLAALRARGGGWA